MLKQYYDNCMGILVNNIRPIAITIMILLLIKLAIPVYQLIQDNASQRVVIGHISAKVDKLATKVAKHEIILNKHAQSILAINTDLFIMQDSIQEQKETLAKEQRLNKRFARDIKAIKNQLRHE